MTGIRLLECAIQPYAWGSHTAIAEIQRRPTPSDGPEAELWIGDHPNAPSRVRPCQDEAETVELRDFLAGHRNWLSPAAPPDESAPAVAPRLPFLLKILAADAPLSLQVHPSAERARQAFAAGHPAYVDDQPKPEILCALTPFRAMVGFRPFDESAELTRHLLSGLTSSSPARAPLSRYLNDPSSATLRTLIADLHQLPTQAVGDLIAALHQLDLTDAGDRSDTQFAVQELLRHYPDDPLCVAPILLRVVTLEPGEAIHTEAGILHSYLGGTGVELMNTSDNVLRAGLTEKAVHLDELLNVTVFEPTPPGLARRVTAEDDPFDRFKTPSPTFELGILDWERPQTVTAPPSSSVQILLCTRGEFQIAGASDQAVLRSGQALLVGATWGPFRLEGEGQLFRATVPSS